MIKTLRALCLAIAFLTAIPASAGTADFDELLPVLRREISGKRAYEYVKRLWQYEKWCTLPMWKKAAEEAHAIMEERSFDEADIVNTPADGVTKYADWTNPVGWDVKQANLEVIEPYGLPDEYRFLCNYRLNPTSLTFFSCPTPPEGIEAELVVADRVNPKALNTLNAQGKIILVSSRAGSMKKNLAVNGILGIVSDQAVGDYIDENAWLNTWSDSPGGWLMTAADSKNSFCFSISNKKGTYLRKLISEGKTVKVRAKIDSRYYTDDTLPYLTGCIRGTGDEGEEVLIAGHMFEWGANDNCTGCSIMLESVGVLNDLIRSGTLPRPKRSIRIWMGQEMYGSLAFAEHNPDRLRNTIAAVCCDTPAANHDLTASTVKIYMNGNFCPSFTDALYPEVFRLYYERTQSNKLLITLPYGGGTDNYFCEPMIGVPTNFVYMENGTWLHHNSRDTIEKVDTRSLDDLCSVNALYLYFLADADLEEIPYIARLTFDRGVKVILKKSSEMNDRLVHANDGVALGKVMTEGVNVIEYYTEVQKKALVSIERIVSKRDRGQSQKMLSKYIDNIDDFGILCIKQFRDAVKEKSKLESLKIVPYKKEKNPWDREAETLIPKPMYIGTLTLDGVPVEEWKEVTSSPRWWSPTSWAVASYWWCDGKRNLKEIRELIELEAGVPVQNFDMIPYYRFLEKYGRVEFVK